MCDHDFEEGRAIFNDERQRKLKERLERAAHKHILRMIRGYIHRARFKKIIAKVMRVQAATRRHICRRDFQAWRRLVKRPYYARVHHATDLGENAVGHELKVIITIMDVHRHRQLFRFDSSPMAAATSPAKARKRGSSTVDVVRWDQEFLVPGTPGNVTVVATVVRMDAQADKFLGQGHIAVRKTDLLLKLGHGPIELQLRTQLLTVRDSEFKLKEMKQIPDHVPTGKVLIELGVLNSMYSMCGSLVGPHPDVMRRRAAPAAMLNTSRAMGRRVPWWCVVANGKLGLYRRYGDPHPNRSVSRSAQVLLPSFSRCLLCPARLPQSLYPCSVSVRPRNIANTGLYGLLRRLDANATHREISLKRVDIFVQDGGETGAFSIRLPDKKVWSFETEAVKPRSLVPWLFALEYWKTTTAKPLPALCASEFSTLVNFVVFNRAGQYPEQEEAEETEGQEDGEDEADHDHGFAHHLSREKLARAAEAAGESSRVRLPAVRRYIGLLYNPMFT
mmetsp:Transcript_49471/g.140164  ORF Transcript_49471/g.140164 Transcript_49471/m.140164 type:complete len:504 (+) Transcript_49471:947-2458(+)